MKTIRDGVHGDIQLTELEMSVVDTAAFQRLRGIKQLGTSHLVFPSAGHSRFEHSLGTCWMARVMLGHLREQLQDELLDTNAEQLLGLGALLHDITHVPFGHTFEDERRIFLRHDESTERLEYFLKQGALAVVLEKSGHWPALIKLMNKNSRLEGQHLLIRDMVSGTICADLLDYLQRDAFFCGINQSYDERVFQYLRADEQGLYFDLQRKGQFRPDALSELIHLLRLRYTLTERVYYHHAKVASGAMLSKALELCLRAGVMQQQELYLLKDDSFLHVLREKGQSVPGVVTLLDDLAAHRIYKCIYALQTDGPHGRGLSGGERDEFVSRYHLNGDGARDQLEMQLAAALKIPQADVIVSCPDKKMSLKEADIRVRYSHEQIDLLSRLDNPEINVLLEKHRALWKFRVFLRREHLALAGKGRAILEDILKKK